MDDLDLGSTIRGFSAGQKVFGRFTLKRIIGRGGMGVVWLAQDEELERDVALKFLPEIVALDRESVTELKRETRRNLDLTHPHIVRIYDFVQDARAAAISMEFVNGASLSALKVDRPDGVFPLTEVSRWATQLCEALSYAHGRAKVVHRDLKPANLMIDGEGNLKITDFGIACSISDSVSRVSKNIGSSGTPLYMSPQQMMGEKPTPADDIYSLGATLYELLAGKPPFYTGNIILQVQNKAAPGISERRQELGVTAAEPVPTEWEAVILACLQKEAAARPGSVAEVAERLKLSGTFIPAAPPEVALPVNGAAVKPVPPAVTPTVAAAPHKRSRAGLWLGLAAGLLVLAAAGVWAGDVPNRIKASQQMSRAQQALFASDWPTALLALRDAVTLRPTDAEYRREFDEAQKRWLDMVEQEIAGLDARTVYDRITARVPAAVALVEPYSERFRRLSDEATAAARTVVEQAAGEAGELSAEGKYDEALAKLGSVRAHAGLMPGYDTVERGIRVARVRTGIAEANAARDQQAYDVAYATLEEVRADSSLVAEEFGTAHQLVREAEMRTRLQNVRSTAEAEQFARALDDLAALREEKVLPDEVEETAGYVRQLAETFSLDRLGRALLAGDRTEADAAVSDYAKFTGATFSVTGGELIDTTDLSAFLAALENLRMRPAAGQLRTGGRDIALVASIRTRFADQAAVTTFLQEAYMEWSRAEEKSGHPGLALFLRSEAQLEGAAKEPELEHRLSAGLAAHVGFELAWSPTKVDGRADAVLQGEPVKALKAALGTRVARIMRVVDGPGTLAIDTVIKGPVENDRPNRERKSVRYQSGTRSVTNYRYTELQNALRDAQEDMNQAQRAMRTAEAEAKRQASNTTDYNAALASALAGGISVGIYQNNYNKALNRANSIRNELRNTPRTLQEAVYADEPYDVITHNLTYGAELVAVPQGSDRATRWSAELTHRTVEITGNKSRGVPVQAPAYPASAAINRELAQQLAGKVKVGAETFLPGLVYASFYALENRLVARGIDWPGQMDQHWSLVLLWRSIGIEPALAGGIEQGLRQSLGLPQR